MDDPITILSAAGVSVPEVEEYSTARTMINQVFQTVYVEESKADAAVLATAERCAERIAELEREVAKIESQRKAMECCGTCSNFNSFGSAEYCMIECPERIHAYDHERYYDSDCQYEPSCWEPALYDAEEVQE